MLLPPAEPASSLLLMFLLGSWCRSRHWALSEEHLQHGWVKVQICNAPSSIHGSYLQSGKYSTPLIAEAVFLQGSQLFLRLLRVNLLLNLPIKVFFIFVFIISHPFTALFRNDKKPPHCRLYAIFSTRVHKLNTVWTSEVSKWINDLPVLTSSTNGLAEREPFGARRLVSIWRPSKCSPGVSLGTQRVKRPIAT